MNSSLSDAETRSRLITALDALGLVIMGWRDAKTLPGPVWLDSAPRTTGSILVLGNGGGALWSHFNRQRTDTSAHPLDDFSLDITDGVLAGQFACARQPLFPASDCTLDLLTLLSAVGWQQPSPLGLGINARYGLWSAVRAVWWVDRPTPVSDREPFAADVCASCESRACVATCPAGAVTYGSVPDLGACASYRFEPDSRCEQTCLARQACPVATEHRYGEAQLAFHYRLDGSLMAQFRR